MQNKNTWLPVVFFAIVEIAIGVSTLTGLIVSLITRVSTKPPAVIVFVTATSLVSLSLGIGLIRHSSVCYRALVYFATVVILSKILIFAGIITLSGALETVIPSGIKNTVSIFYHSLILLYLTQPAVKQHHAVRLVIAAILIVNFLLEALNLRGG